MSDNDQDREVDVEVRFSPDEVMELDSWIAEHGQGLSRAGAIKVLVRRSIEIDREWTRAKRAIPDEGLRPEELTSENDG